MSNRPLSHSTVRDRRGEAARGSLSAHRIGRTAPGRKRTWWIDDPASAPFPGGLVPVLPPALGPEEDRASAGHRAHESGRIRPLEPDARRVRGSDATRDAAGVPGDDGAGAASTAPQAPRREVPELR